MSDHVAGSLDQPAFLLDDGAEDGDEWPARAGRRGLSIRIPVAALLALLIAAGAFWGGAAVQKSRENGAGGATSALRSLFAGRSGRSSSRSGGLFGALGGASGGASGPAATGTLTVVEGSALYVTESSGTIVKVVLAPSAAVTRDAAATLSQLHPGDTIVIEGATGKDGTVTASSVSATAPGVPASTGGGFSGFGGGTGGSGSTTSGSAGTGSGSHSGSGSTGSGGTGSGTSSSRFGAGSGSSGSGSSARNGG